MVFCFQYECCGVYNYTDFDIATKWDRNVEIGGKNVTLVTPIACCALNGTFPHATPLDESCSYEPNDVNNNWQKVSSLRKGMFNGICLKSIYS